MRRPTRFTITIYSEDATDQATEDRLLRLLLKRLLRSHGWRCTRVAEVPGAEDQQCQ
jgi:hypothetical protein